MALHNKQVVFVDAYLSSFNATQAALEAGYSKKTARSIGSENLTKPDIQALIQERMNERKISADEVLMLLIDQARASIRPFIKFNSEGFFDFDLSQPEALKYLHTIKKIKVKRTRRIVGRGDKAEAWEDETTEIELHDAQNALQLLGSHFGLFDNKPPTFQSLEVEGLQEMLDKVYGEKNTKSSKRIDD